MGVRKHFIDPKKLKEVYFSGLSIKDVAYFFGLKERQITYLLYSNEIRKRKRRKNIYYKINVKKLKKLYIRGLKNKELCNIFNCSWSTLRKCIKKNKMEGLREKIHINKNKLKKAYISGMKYSDMSKFFKYSRSTIIKYLKKYNILGLKRKNNRIKLYISKKWLIDHYIKMKMTIQQCAEELKIKKGCIGWALKRYNIRTRKPGDILESTRLKLRKSVVDRITKLKGQVHPMYNPIACKFFDYINNRFLLNGIHAENKGELYINGLHYWVDYYEPTINMVLEWNEPRHFSKNQIKKDKIRNKEIQQHLGCKLFVIDQRKIKDTNDYDEILNKNIKIKNLIDSCRIVQNVV